MLHHLPQDLRGPLTESEIGGRGGRLRRRWGMFSGSYAVMGGVSTVVPVDVVIRRCPPTPKQLLAGLPALFGA